MRQFHLRQQQQPLRQAQQHVRSSAHAAGCAAPARSKAPAIDETLDQAAALWTTRRIRSFFLLLDSSAGSKQR